VFIVNNPDNPPILHIVAPLNATVTRGQVYVEATATDDDPSGTVINVYVPYNPARPIPQLRGTNSIRGYLPAASPVVFEAIDSAGQTRYIPRQVIYEPSTNLVETALAPGLLLDVKTDRFLYTFVSDVTVAAPPWPFDWQFGAAEPKIFHRDSGQTVA